MGVRGLWDAVATSSKIIHPESLENKTFVIDGSFWIRHISASRENSKYNSDFISIFFKRLCKLLSYKIRPIIVFDGIAPYAKRCEIKRRANATSKLSDRNKRLAFKRIAKQIFLRNSSNVPKKASNEDGKCDIIENSVIKTEGIRPLNDYLFDSSDDLSGDSDYVNECSELVIDDKFHELPLIEKFNLLKKLQKRSFNSDRSQLVNFDGTISDFSDQLFKIYMKNASVNKLLNKVKLESHSINIALTDNNDLFQQPFNNNNVIHNVWLDSDDIVKDYNTLVYTSVKKRRYLNDFQVLNDSHNPIQLDDIKLSTDNVDEDKMITFTNDADLFGEEFITDFHVDNSLITNLNDREPITKPHNHNSSDDESDEWELVNHISNNITANNLETYSDENLYLNQNHTQIDNNRSIKSITNQIEIIDTGKSSIAEIKDRSPIPIVNNEFLFKSPTVNLSDHNTSNLNNCNKDKIHINTDINIDIPTSVYDSAHKTANKSKKGVVSNVIDDSKVKALKTANNDWFNICSEESLNLVSRYSKLIDYEEFDDICNLLKLFNIYFLFAPSEAEAECAQLNIENKAFGVISDDSDTLVFGAKRVIKNFFNKQKNLELYQLDDIKKMLGLSREKMALIAVLCGCDYTCGVKGIGVVNALEIIEVYPTFDDLYDFRDWATDISSNTDDPCEKRHKYKVKHEKCRCGWIFYTDFPNAHAYNLLISPKVNKKVEIPQLNEFTQLDAKSIENITLFMNQKSKLPSSNTINYLNELNRCLSNSNLNKQLKLYDLDGVVFNPAKRISRAPDRSIAVTGDINCATIKSARMRCSIETLKSNPNIQR